MIWQPYARVSERGSTWHAQGIESSCGDQLTAIERHIHAADENPTILPPIIDEFECGKDLDRPGMRRIMAEMPSKKWDNLIARDFDRVVWGMKATCELLEAIAEHKKGLVCLEQRWEFTTAIGKAMLLNNIVFAQYQREKCASDTRKRMFGIAEQGGWPAGNVPFGYRRPGKHANILEPDPEQAPVVQALFADYLSGTGPTELARRYGLSKRVILDTLKHRIHLGEIPYGGKIFQGKHTPLVSRDDWEAAQAAMPKTKRQPRPRRQKYPFILSGLIQCECGRAMTPETANGRGGKYYYYRCTDNVNCKTRVSAGVIEKQVLDALKGFTLDTELIEETFKEINKQWRASVIRACPPPQELDTAIQMAKSEQRQVEKLFLTGLVDPDNAASFNEQLRSARARVSTLQDKKQQITKALSPDVDILKAARRWFSQFRDIGSAIHGSDPDRQLDIINAMISGIKKAGRTWHVSLHKPGSSSSTKWQPLGDQNERLWVCLIVTPEGWGVAA